MRKAKRIASDPRKLFGENLRTLRKKQGWSQERLAFEAKLDRTYVGGVERGESNISLINICRLAKALGLPPSALLVFDEPEK